MSSRLYTPRAPKGSSIFRVPGPGPVDLIAEQFLIQIQSRMEVEQIFQRAPREPGFGEIKRSQLELSLSSLKHRQDLAVLTSTAGRQFGVFTFPDFSAVIFYPRSMNTDNVDFLPGALVMTPQDYHAFQSKTGDILDRIRREADLWHDTLQAAPHLQMNYLSPPKENDTIPYWGMRQLMTDDDRRQLKHFAEDALRLFVHRSKVELPARRITLHIVSRCVDRDGSLTAPDIRMTLSDFDEATVASEIERLRSDMTRILLGDKSPVSPDRLVNLCESSDPVGTPELAPRTLVTVVRPQGPTSAHDIMELLAKWGLPR